MTVSLVAIAATALSRMAAAQSAEDYFGPAGVVPLTAEQPAPKIIIDPPLAGPLAKGLVVIQYRAENLRIVPVFGPNALDVTPRIGHIHVTVDDLPWHWAGASDQPLIIQNLPAGPHRVLIELVDANHNPFDRGVVSFFIPPK